MGLLEKLKNTFFEEEYVEVDEVEKPQKNIKREVTPVARKIEPAQREEVKELEEVASTMELAKVTSELEIENQADKELLKTEVEIPYFEDEDFVESSSYMEEEDKKVYGGSSSEIYEHMDLNSNEYEGRPYEAVKEGKSTFKPTPIISPIYGILDKNYRKEEVIDKKDRPSSYVSRKNVDLDFVRNKAFGGLEEDLKNLNFNSKKEEISDFEEQEESGTGLLYDMTESDGTPSVDKVTLADAEEYFEDLGLEYNIDYTDIRHEKITGRRSRTSREEVVDSFPTYEESEEKDEVKVNINININDEVPEEDTYQEPEKRETKLEDNLFDLVDSMYEERE